MTARDEMAKLIAESDGIDMTGWDESSDRRPVKYYANKTAAAILAAGYAKRETVTEWAAAFLRTGNVYNFHRTREEAQACVDGFREAGAEMVVMTREVLPQDASAWRAAQ
jgi:hypothetical protein